MRAVSSRLSRAKRTFAALGFLALGVGMLLTPAGAQTGGAATASASLSSQGWWEKQPNLPNVPATALPVTAQSGAPTRISAIGMDVHIPDDELLVKFTLTMKEAAGPGANYPPITAESQAQPQTNVLVVACPITSIYTPEDGGNIDTSAPQYDCGLARGDGIRNHTAGTWEFDLASLVELWSSNTIEQNGIVLVEWVNQPMSFQVTFQDLSTNTAVLTLETEPVEEDSAEEEEFEEEFEDFIDTGTDTGEDENFFEAVGDDVTGTPTTPFGITDTPPTTAPPAPEPAEEAAEPAANRQPTKGSLPLGALALIPIGLGLALLFGVVLGPAGDPATARTREGGLSRALARRTTAPQQ